MFTMVLHGRKSAANEGSAEWTPGQLGSYLLCYEIYNRDGGLIEQSFTGYSIEEPYMKHFRYLCEKRRNDEVFYGGFCFNQRQSMPSTAGSIMTRAAGTFGTTSAAGALPTATTWNAPKEGYYWLYVEAKIHGDITKSYTMGYTVNRYPADLESMMYLANAYSSSTPIYHHGQLQHAQSRNLPGMDRKLESGLLLGLHDRSAAGPQR